MVTEMFRCLKLYAQNCAVSGTSHTNSTLGFFTVKSWYHADDCRRRCEGKEQTKVRPEEADLPDNRSILYDSREAVIKQVFTGRKTAFPVVIFGSGRLPTSLPDGDAP